MVKSHTPGNDDNLIERMIAKARRLAGLTPEHRQLIAFMREQARRRAADMCRDPLPTPDTPPEEFVETLRLPAGEQQHITVVIDGHDIQLVLNPAGEADPQREDEVWRWLLRRIRQEAAS